ncbi:hypothetical protein [Nostoc sp.]|uniref:hypothetical protein n=1 Tax=Nostoc sp. TaxID=1180 RepID=UPI002FFB8FDB
MPNTTLGEAALTAYLGFATSTPTPSSVRVASRREAEMLSTSAQKIKTYPFHWNSATA